MAPFGHFRQRSARRTAGTAGRSRLFALNVGVDRLGGRLAGAHGQDDRGRAGDCVAAGKHALTAGLTLLVGNDAAAAVGLQTIGSGADCRAKTFSLALI